jgi:hypothetical protein
MNKYTNFDLLFDHCIIDLISCAQMEKLIEYNRFDFTNFINFTTLQT